ncbi:TetR/AcrR family transcriptional regulator [Amycolatopsis alkalitolerans]|uniref:TetR/AcrR family transcriptional regulator n=1 Tax=Amycolatopsis alkalitolerans TaxID=2547244 RepID=A0A5C4M4Q2_9PSEU|nr:TetR/AcrR family transcriptional regulator [Amycolatopsis alkalitolerans]TNC27614.1 TetR/AcrR family transcriptional regulator [Amycolatopsis alkalitolerans]
MNVPDPAPPGKKRGGARAPRADALRNRDRLLQVARAAFAAGNDTVSLEGIAREAGVGIGTLYRHFPTREALVEAVYAAELDDVTGSVPGLLRRLPPEAALRAWMGRYAAFIATKHGMAETLRAGWASGRIATPATRERVTAAVATILARGAEAGSLRADVEPEDITVMLLGVLLTSTAGHTPEQTERLLDLVMDALRPTDRER